MCLVLKLLHPTAATLVGIVSGLPAEPFIVKFHCLRIIIFRKILVVLYVLRSIVSTVFLMLCGLFLRLISPVNYVHVISLRFTHLTLCDLSFTVLRFSTHSTPPYTYHLATQVITLTNKLLKHFEEPIWFKVGNLTF